MVFGKNPLGGFFPHSFFKKSRFLALMGCIWYSTVHTKEVGCMYRLVLDPGKEKCIFEEKSQGERNADFFRFLAEFLQAWNLGFKYAARGFRVFRKEIRAHVFPNP